MRINHMNIIPIIIILIIDIVAFLVYSCVITHCVSSDSDDMSLSSGDHKFSKSSMSQNKKRKKRRHR